LEVLGTGERIILKYFSNKWGMIIRTGFIWFRIGSSDELL
jgi:hypothetical protein